jgi:predicted amidophosphoribosyltransferase
MIARLEFASCYVYSPAGAGELCERSRLLRELLKEGNARFMISYARRVRTQMADSPQLAGFLSPADVLVPVPGCVPRSNQHGYVASRLAEALVRQGLGHDTWNGLKRIRRVRKSSTAPSSARPSVAVHYESFSIDAWARSPASLVLVDDVITKGRTLLAAAVRLHEAFPAANIRAFALLRTQGLIPEVRRLLEPCRGLISWRGGDARRNP